MPTMVDARNRQTGEWRLRAVVGAVVVLVHLGLIAAACISPAPPPAPLPAKALMVNVVVSPLGAATLPHASPKVDRAAPVFASPRPVAVPVLPPPPPPALLVDEKAEALPRHQAVMVDDVPAAALMTTPAVAPAGHTGVVLLSAPKAVDRYVLPAGVKQLTVRLRLLVNVRGRVEKVALEMSSGYSSADERAMNDVRDYRFKPAMEANVPVAREIVLPIKYEEGN